MAKLNFNGTTDALASKEVVAEHNGRQTFVFAAIGGDMTLNFGLSADADSVLFLAEGERISLNAKDPYDIKKAITVYAAAAVAYECQVEQ